MQQKETNRNAPRESRLRFLIMLVVFAAGVLTVGSSLQAQTHAGVFGGFGGTFPGSYVNGGTLHTEDSANAFHIWSSLVIFDVNTGFIEGEGPFSMVLDGAPGGGTVIQGRWEATKFLDWKFLGLCRDNAFCLTGGPFGVAFPPDFTAGRMRTKVVLYDSSGDKLGNATLTIWCSLPGIPYGKDKRDPMGRGIEQYRLKVSSGSYKGLVFDVGRSGTVFRDLSLIP